MSRSRLVEVELPDPMHLEGWEENDEPLASDPHSDEQAYCFYALRYLLNPDGHYVSKDRWLRMDPHNSGDKLLPDLLIALGLQERQWGTDEYLPWEVGKPPEVLAEFLSPSSEDADQVHKPRRYGGLGVKEYFLFDPDGTYGVPRLQGWTLYGEDEREPLPRDSGGGVASRVLPVRFVLTGGHIGVVDTRTGEPAPRYEELQRLLREEIELQERLRQEANAEQGRLRRELAAREEQLLREVEARQGRLRQEEAARENAEREVQRLREELNRLRRDRA